MLTSLRKKGYYISLIVNHENKQAHAPSDLAVDRELTKPTTCRAASMDLATARNLEPRAVCKHHSHATRRDEAPWLGFKVTLDRHR